MGKNLVVGSVVVSQKPNVTMSGSTRVMAQSGTTALTGLGRFTRSISLTTTTIDSSISQLGASEFYINSGRLQFTRDHQAAGTANLHLHSTGIINSAGVKNTFGNLYIYGDSTMELGDAGELSFNRLGSWSTSGVIPLLNIQNDSGEWNTVADQTLGGEHVWFVANPFSAGDVRLANIAFTGYTRGAGIVYNNGKYELVTAGEKGYEWSGGGLSNTNWDAGANWYGNAAPNGAGAIAIFRDADDRLNGKTIKLNGSRTLGKIFFEATSDASFTIAPTSTADSLTLSNSGSHAVIYMSGVSSPTISANLILEDSLLVDHRAKGKNLTLSGAISGTEGIRFTVDPAALGNSYNQDYRLTLSGNNNFSGGIEQQGGMLYINNDNALGSGTYTVTGTATIYANGNRVLTNALKLDGGLSSQGSMITFKNNTGLITGGTKSIYTYNSSGLIFDSDYILTGSAGLHVQSASFASNYYQLIMRGQNTFSGGVTLNNGGIKIGASSQVADGLVVSGPLGTGTYTFSNGATYLENTTQHHVIHNPLSLGANGNVYLGYYAPSSLQAGSLTFDSIEDLKLRSGQNNFYLMGAMVEFKNSITNPDSGSGTFYLTQYTSSPAFLRLSGSNSFTGGLTINSNYGSSASYQTTLSIANDAALGTGTLTLSGYHITLQAHGADRNIGNLVYFNNSSYTTYFTAAGGAQNMLFSGSGNSTVTSGNKYWDVAGNMTVTFGTSHNLVGSSASITKQGAGELQLLAPKSTFRNLTVSAGTVSTVLLEGRDMVLQGAANATQDSYFGTGVLSINGSTAVARIETWSESGTTGNVYLNGNLTVSNGGMLQIVGGGNLHLNSNQTISATGNGNISIGDGGALFKEGEGTVSTLNTSIIAPITIRGGALSLATTNLLNNVSNLNMAGGSLLLNGLSQTLGGNLSLTGASLLDIGVNSLPKTFTVADLGIWNTNHILQVLNWDGVQSVGGGNTQIIIGNYTGAMEYVPNVWFQGYAPGAILLDKTGGTKELVPYAQSFNWTGASSSDWTAEPNWSSFQSPNGVGASATFDDKAAISVTGSNILLNENKTLGSLIFSGARNQRFNITSNGSPAIIFDFPGDIKNDPNVTALILMRNNSDAYISAPIDLRVNLQIDNVSGADIELAGTIFDDFGTGRKVTKTGSGMLTLSNGLNSFKAGMVLVDGLLRINAGETLLDGHVNSGAIGTGAFTINGGSIEAYGQNRTLSNRIVIGGDFTVVGSNTLALAYDSTLNSVKSALGADSTITVNNGATLVIDANNTLEVALADSATSAKLTKSGGGLLEINSVLGVDHVFGLGINSGTLVLNAGNAYSGTTELAGGVLVATNDRSLGTSSVEVLSSATLSLSAPITLDNGITLSNAPLVVDAAHTGTLSGEISGTGVLTKISAGTLTLSASNSFTGTARINAGTLRATNAGSLGEAVANVAAPATLNFDSFTGTVANNITGSGTVLVTSASIALSGTNSSFAGAWHARESSRVAISDTIHLGTGNVVLEGALLVEGANNFTLNNALTGSGTVTFASGGTQGFGAGAGTGFTGKAEAASGHFVWNANSSSVLNTATLALTGGLLDVTPGVQTANSFVMNGGTAAFTGTARVADFAITGSSNILFDQSVAQAMPLLQQDEGGGRAYVIAQNWDGDVSNLHLVLADGTRIGASSTLAIGTGTEALGVYSNTLTAAGGTLGVAYQLKELQLQAGKTLTLTGDIATPAGGDELHALISGSGNLLINAINTITLNTAATHTGTTTTGGGTLKAGAANVVASSTHLVNDAVFDTNSFAQTVQKLTGSGTILFGGGTLVIQSGSYDGLLAGANTVLEKTTGDTLTLSASNTYTGTTLVTGGTLRLASENAAGGSTINAASVLDLALTGSFANTINGSGTAQVSGNVAITGANNIAAWNITGTARVAEQQNLGSGATHIDGELSIASSSAWSYANALTGSGILKVDTSGTVFSFSSSAFSPSGRFSGTVDMRHGFFQLDGISAGVGASPASGTGVMRDATLVLGANAATLLGSGSYYLGGLAFEGGTLKVEMDHATTPKGKLTVGDLTDATSGKLALDNWHKVSGTTPDGTDFFYQDSGTLFEQIVNVTGNVNDVGAQLDLHDFDGALITDATLKQIHENGGVSGTAIYDYGAEVVDDGNNKGIYLAYMLRELSANSGTSVTLNNIGTQDATSTLNAKLTGEGGFVMGGTGVYYIGSAESSYTGTTSVTSGTVALHTDNAFGNTARLDIAANTGVDLNGNTQAVGAFSGSANSALNFNSGTLIISGTDAAGLATNSVSNGALTGAGALVVQGNTLTVNGANTAFAANTSINNTAAVVLTHAQGLGTGAITADGQLVFDAATGANANSISGTGLVSATNAANIILNGNNASFSGTWQIAAGGAFKSVGENSLGAGGVANTGTLVLGGTSPFTLHLSNFITGAGTLVKEDAGTVTISHSNAYTGNTFINAGGLNLAHLGALGTGTVGNSASLRLGASGTFANALTGAGATVIAADGVNIAGANAAYTGTWNVTGSGTMTAPENLGVSGAAQVNIAAGGSLALVGMGGDYKFDHQLTGGGALLVNNSGTIAFGSTTGTNFAGRVVLQNNRLDLTAENTLALTNATLVVDKNNRTDVGGGAQNIGNLELSSGTIAFTMDASGTAAGIVNTGTLAVGDSVVMVDTSGMDVDALTLLQQDEGLDIQLVTSTTLAQGSKTIVSGSNLVDKNGNELTGASQRDIAQSGGTVASGTYDFAVTADNDGLQLSYTLTHLELLADKTAVLDGEKNTPLGADELHALVSGSGNLQISATGAITLNNGGNTYSGTTLVTGGTLVAGNSGALGNTSMLSISSTASADLNHTAQTVGAIYNAGALLFNGGTLTVANGGASTGAMSGTGALNLDGGNLLVTDANTALAITTSIAASATATLNHASALGDAGSVFVGGALVLDVQSSTAQPFNLSLLGAGDFVKASTGTVTIPNANPDFTGSGFVDGGGLVLMNLAALAGAPIEVSADAALGYHNVSGTLANNVSGSGTMRIANSALSIEHDNVIANSLLEGATVWLSATHALGLDSASVLAGADSTILIALDGARLGHVTLAEATLGFVHNAPAFHRATVAGLAGASGTLGFNVDFTGISGLKQSGEVANHLTVTGGSAGVFTVRITALGNLPSNDETAIPLITDTAGTAFYQLESGKLEFGLTEFKFANGASSESTLSLDPGTWYLYSTGLSQAADAIIDTASLIGKDWHYSLDALYLRMGDIRGEGIAAAAGSIWTRARGHQLNATNPLSGRRVKQHSYGVTAGGDKAFGTGTGVNLFGAFVDMGRITRDFGRNSDGKTTNASFGLYGTMIKNNGWYADLVLKADRYKHRFDVSTISGRPVHGRYNSNAWGGSLEIGRRIEHAGGWWMEPSVQAAVARLEGASYRTTPSNAAIDVKVDDATSAQYRGMVRFGRQLKDTRWSFYGKFGVVKTDTNDGEIHAHGRDLTVNFDGWRMEAGAGVGYRINSGSQLYFDYEYGRAKDYERPWALNLGYRRLW
ncbi:hypothetical protein CKA38_05385 [Ereboglobus luteus]|uniref:Autotransporter domain-containing protein n=1 Tax=Ereboglobus luteus TaxID=1796921 RepID=A0A2U8E2K5_9BACT|nr:hypothetical protein CKA38_05385 [Ereboglobus luteus]